MRMFATLCALCVAAGVLLGVMPEQRNPTITDAIIMLNGSPHLAGIMTVIDGGSTNNWLTMVRDAGGTFADGGPMANLSTGAFDAGTGIMAWIVCDGGAHVVAGAGDTTAATGYDWPVLGDEKLYIVLQNNENAIAIKPRAGNASVACGVYKAK